MIIDSHVYVFPEKIAGKALAKLSSICGLPCCSDGTVDDTRKKLSEWKADGAVCLSIATNPHQQSSVNSWAASIQGDGLWFFGSVHPDSPDALEELVRIKKLGLHGVKFHPDYQGFFIDDKKMFPIYETISSLHLPVAFHCGWDPLSPDCIHAPSQRVARVAELFPEMTVIAAHMGGMRRYEEAEEYLRPQKNLYLDTAMSSHYCPQEQFNKLIQKHGAEHILFASDCPWSRSCDELALLDKVPLSGSERELILSGNILRILSGS